MSSGLIPTVAHPNVIDEAGSTLNATRGIRKEFRPSVRTSFSHKPLLLTFEVVYRFAIRMLHMIVVSVVQIESEIDLSLR
jgi:hypothetical protein